ncbi:MAG: ATP-binding cassette domain-containing protein, partial [Coriobacteriales bacterium]|nr:ATP-binding cassette domain-containing protein [Coriobacteriales bacterium]
MPETILELRHITKQFPGVIANNDVCLEIYRGEVFALLGENGAGKSTLASIIFGLYSPDSGEIILRGEPVSIANPAQTVELDIGMVHQHFKLVSDYSVTENIILGNEPIRRFFGLAPAIDYRTAAARVQQLIEEYGFDLDSEAVIEDLNVSSRQRVELLKMLYRNAEILIFDEPTAMLTPQETDRLLEIIRRLRSAGKTIVLISHQLEEIKSVADRCGIMNHGRLIDIYDVKTTSTQLMANRMVGRELNMQIEKNPHQFGSPILEINDLSVVDNLKVRRLTDINLTVHAGEVFALAGVSGNGQIELADALAGLLPHSGQIKINGQDISHFGVRKRYQQGLAYIPEDRQGVGLILDFSVAENLISKSYYQPP